MEVQKNDITSHLINPTEIHSRIEDMFPDSLLVNNRFQIISLSKNLRESLNFTSEELGGESINMLSQHGDLESELREQLREGVFDETQILLTSKDGQSILFSISGFYLGLLADVNNLIILKLRNLDEINLMYNRLEAKTAEVDRFVYLSAHSLRGPLATMKGLLNLLKMSKNEEEKIFLMEQIDLFGQKLDNKLHSLIYFAESDKGEEFSKKAFTNEMLGERLQALLSEMTIDVPVDFKYNMGKLASPIQNGQLVLSLLNNLLSFFMQLPKEPGNSLAVDAIHSTSQCLEITVRSHGFVMHEELQEQIHNVNFGYSEILKYPDLLTCYAAKKIIFKLRGNIQFILISNEDAFIHIVLPKIILED